MISWLVLTVGGTSKKAGLTDRPLRENTFGISSADSMTSLGGRVQGELFDETTKIFDMISVKYI